jgi:TfoX/Sxy family transcriptional regulator of competence genes
MKAWSAALAAEVTDWPQVSARSFFGFNALYRGDSMFAALPRTRAMITPNSLVFKLVEADTKLQKRLRSDSRIGSMEMKNARWYTFEISSDRDLHDALDWIGLAYGAAGKKKKKSRRPCL